ncbi:hypothetical protein [Streptosporangium sp. NPDC002721]|uniref:hypothetical protein n=1 Tax=Streptosporangium sp. NPDC002721 TaxID=3366188 RepID=UPI0036740B58
MTPHTPGGASGSPHSLGHRIWARMTKWLIVSIMVGLSPVIINASRFYTNGKPSTGFEVAVFGTGELYLVSTGIIAAGIGELFFELKTMARVPDSPGIQISKSVAVSISVLLAIICAGSYGGAPPPSEAERYMDLSIYMLLGAMITSASCAILSEF